MSKKDWYVSSLREFRAYIRWERNNYVLVIKLQVEYEDLKHDLEKKTLLNLFLI